MKRLKIKMIISFLAFFASALCLISISLSLSSTAQTQEWLLSEVNTNETQLTSIESAAGQRQGRISRLIFTPEVFDQELDHHFPQRLEVVAVLHNEVAFNGTHDIEVQNGLAYLAGKGGSLAVVDVNEPAQPRLLWYVRDLDKYDEAETVMPLSSHRLLVGTRDVLLFDVSDPAQPRLLDKIEDREHVNLINGFARRGDIVFGANKEGYIFAVDVSDPDNVHLVGVHETSNSGEMGQPHDIAFSGDLLVVVSPEGFGRGLPDAMPGRLTVYSVFDPDSGKLLPSRQWELIGQIKHLRLAGANRVMTQGWLACVGSSLSVPHNFGRNDDLRPNVSVVDLSDPTRPRLRGSLDFPDERGPNGLEWIGNTAFAAGAQTVQAIDLSNPDMPRQNGLLFSPEAFPGAKTVRGDDGHDLVLVGDHLFVTAQSSNSLVVIRVAPEVTSN